ncbi:MAG TPA: ABC transporter permease [Candidatus Thermoplasmatota archaeon]|nr:ABC transporter permease [Candidatus Thermoplasmatota archaeon]
MSYLSGYRLHPMLTFRVWQRELTLYKRIWPSTILSTLFDPILYLLAMGFGVGAYITQDIEGVSYLQFIAPGLVASSAMYAAAYEAAWNSYVRIFHERSYEAMMTTPADLEDVVAGEIAWGATRSLVYSIVMLGVLFAFGLIRSPYALLVPLVAFLGGTMFMVLGLAYTVRIKHMDQLTFLFTLGVTPMFLFSGVFFPLAGLPAWVQTVAWASPLYHLVEVVRALAIGALSSTTLLHLAWMVGVTLALWGLPSLVLRRRLRG